MRRHVRVQADQCEVPDDCYHVTSTSELLFQGSRYYNCLLLWTQAPLSMESSKRNRNLVKNLLT